MELSKQLRLTPERVAMSQPVAANRREVTLEVEGIFKPVVLPLVPTAQHLGGKRWWWACPACGRRCAILLRRARAQEFGCRRCLKAVYLRDRPSARPLLVHQPVLGWQPSAFDHWQELLRLSAPKKRGVRRGRRVGARAARLLRIAPSLKDPRAFLGTPVRVEMYEPPSEPSDLLEVLWDR